MKHLLPNTEGKYFQRDIFYSETCFTKTKKILLVNVSSIFGMSVNVKT